ncbi:proprotein convertase P-domain-containing protein [Chiayiivirga flava]|uniref:Subtilisin-like proprotein convertase family protein n=1 Tax=Chiayiivirga flava TaxID=659595 RepID=A0A7W8D5P9_9GAMM|nr:proprotein convertase P-domain-containing protein [Chiayiivirga flava]MBB5208391.1 subtilisin-like proprotein convertase family protein [Chiayiivirga flava]
MNKIPRSVAMRLAWLLCIACPQAWGATFTFPGQVGSGAIPDNATPGLVVPFEVGGLATPTRTVRLRLQITHTWIGDLDAVLVSPDGRARMTVFSRVRTARTSTNGDSSNLGGTYEFADDGGDLWAAALAATGTDAVVAPGTYSATTAGAPGRSDNGGCPTSLTGVFGGLVPAEANGTWTLTVRDAAGGDLGTVALAELIIEDSAPEIFGDGFESIVMSPAATAKGSLAVSHCTNKVFADFTGDGLSDYVLARGVGADIQWSVRANTGNGTAVAEAEAVTFLLGNPTTDFIDALDYDGDRIADPTVWTPTTGTFQIRRSSRSIDPVVSIVFGQDGDDPTQSGDYDGDGRDDLALFRAPPIGDGDGPMTVHIRATASGAATTVFTGFGVDGDAFATSGFDTNGDGLADVSVQEADPTMPSAGRFTILDGRSGAQLAQFVLGNSSDFIIPGNFSGDARFDTTVRRTSGGNRFHLTRDAGTGVTGAEVQFGITGDTSLGGDYDGDRLTDYAVWRGSTTPGASRFIVRPSSAPAPEWEIVGGTGGVSGDFAVASSRVH